MRVPTHFVSSSYLLQVSYLYVSLQRTGLAEIFPRELISRTFVLSEPSKTQKGARKGSFLCTCKLPVVCFFLHSLTSPSDRDMVAHSGKLVSAAEDALTAAASKARDSFNDALERLYETYKIVSNSRIYRQTAPSC